METQNIIRVWYLWNEIKLQLFYLWTLSHIKVAWICQKHKVSSSSGLTNKAETYHKLTKVLYSATWCPSVWFINIIIFLFHNHSFQYCIHMSTFLIRMYVYATCHNNSSQNTWFLNKFLTLNRSYKISSSSLNHTTWSANLYTRLNTHLCKIYQIFSETKIMILIKSVASCVFKLYHVKIVIFKTTSSTNTTPHQLEWMYARNIKVKYLEWMNKNHGVVLRPFKCPCVRLMTSWTSEYRISDTAIIPTLSALTSPLYQPCQP
jgi:hypothetical protein